MRYYVTSLLVTICIIHSGYAQITGQFIDSGTKKIVPFVNVALLNSTDSTQVTGITSNEKGTFMFKNIALGEYFLTGSILGYNKYSSDTIKVTSQEKIINLGSLSITPTAISLKSAEVIAKKQFIEQEAGKKIINVDNDPTGGGDNILELLKKVPGVTVDSDEKIQLNGKSGVLILVDNKPTYLSGDALVAFLKSIPTSMVDKIEVITNPSSKYDAEGVSGILDIKTKKNQNIGVNGSIYANAGYSNVFRHSEGVDLSAHLNKVTAFGSFGYSAYHAKSDSKSETIYPNGTSFETNLADNERWLNKHDSYNLNYKLGADYYINNKNIVGFVWRMTQNNFSNESSSFTRIRKLGIVDSSYNSEGNTDRNYSNNIINLNYKHIFNSLGTEMNVDFDYSNNKSPQISNNNTYNWLGNFSSLQRNENIYNNTHYLVEIISAKLDFEHPFSKKLRTESGVKISYVTNDNKLESELNNLANLEQSNHFVFKENIFAAYSSFNATLSAKTGIKAGLRAEYTQDKGILKTLDTSNARNYFNIFPNIVLSQQLSKIQNLELSYRYRISRPGYYSLNPFLYKYNNYSFSQGNPNLKPQYTHSTSLSYSLKNMYFASVDYSYTVNSYSDMSYFNNVTFTTLTIPENIGKGHYIGSL